MLSFYSLSPDIRSPMKADASALGYLPISAFQYCEAVRTASAIGWYVFPPTAFSLQFDGKETFIADEGEWRSLVHEPLPAALEERWVAEYEETYGACPNMLTAFPDPGVVQVFTGLFVTSTPGTWSHIRPLVNVQSKSAYWCYEGIVETDAFAPLPLFVNIHLTRTHSEIYFAEEFPLFQVACVPDTLRDLNLECATGSVFDADFPRDGLKTTLRRQPGAIVPPGQYGATIRKARKRPE